MSTFKKFKFTTGNEFTFEGSNYTGYYNISGNQAFKSRFLQNEKLTIVDNLNTDIEMTEFYDRDPSTNLILKNKLDDVLFSPNEIINKNSINFKIELLYDNFKSLFRYTKIQNPKLPFSFTNFISFSSLSATAAAPIVNPISGFNVFSTSIDILSVSQFNFSFSGFNPLLSSINFITKGLKGDFTDDSTFMFIKDTTIFTFDLGSNNNTFSFINSTNRVGVFEDLTFDKIVSVDKNTLNDTLFISDSGNNSLFKIDVGSITNRDRNNSRRYFLTNVIGSSGTDQTNFNIIDKLTYGNNTIFVYDRGDKIIKEYNEEFNLLKVYRNFKIFNNNNFVDLKYDKVNEKLYVLFDNFKVLVIDGQNFNTLDEYTFDKNIFINETPKKLLFSNNDSNIFYLITTKNIYKYFVNTKKFNIGKFNTDYNINFTITWEEVNVPPDTWDAATNTASITGRGSQIWDINKFTHDLNIVDVEIIKSDLNEDIFYITTHNGNKKHKILIMKENNNNISFLINENPNFLKFNEILLSNEFFNNISYNNMIYKFLFNLNLLTNDIGKSIFVKYQNDFVVLDSIVTIDNIDKNRLGNITNEKDFYVGVNETASVKVFNRTLTNLYNYIESIGDILNLKYRNIRIPPLSTITF
jgi:hypothetical protein